MNLITSMLHLMKDSFKAYTTDRSIIYAAGLAYYAVFAIAPLLVLVVSIAGVFIGRSNATSQVIIQAQYLVGPQLATLLTDLVQTASQRTFSAGVTVFSVVGLLLSAAGMFTQLDTALNDIWGIRTIQPQSIGDRLILFRHKTAPIIIVFFLGFLLSSAVLIDTLLGAVSSRLAGILPQISMLLPHVNRLVIPALTFATFAVILKWLPDAHSRWRDVAVGALLTTLLFLIGRLLLTIYVDGNETVSLYGTAGSIVVLLIWVYYSAQIVLFGAEFTKLYADRFGQPIEPRKMAIFENTGQAAMVSPPDSASVDNDTVDQG